MSDYIDRRELVGSRTPFRGVNPTMAILSTVIVIAFVLAGALAPDYMDATFTALQNWISINLGWYYVLSINAFMVFVFWLIVSPYGGIRLGGDEERPGFGLFAWFSMLFGAGMGVGLLFWSVAEPLFHIQNSPFVEEQNRESLEGASAAVQTLWLHWGLHAWTVYVIVGLALAYFSYRQGLPLTIRAAFYPILGKRVYGPVGHVIDLLAVFGTVFGIATALGLGAGQLNAGLNHLFGVPDNVGIKILLIAIITAIGTTSVLLGVDRGIKRLSVLNLWLSIVLLIAFIIAAPTVFALSFFTTTLGGYLSNFVQWGLYVDPDSDWQASWTLFYWGWWFAWAPFVGMFIARVSRGRTVREFSVGVLLVPTLITFFWFAIFGGTALHQQFTGEEAGLIAAVNEDITRPFFQAIDNLGLGPISTAMNVIALILITTYFVTSSDSGTLVVTTLIAMGPEEPPNGYRAFWGVGEGAVAAVLLYAGGLEALQAASLAAGLPFSIIMFLMMWGLVRAFQEERARASAATSGEASASTATSAE